MKTQLNTTNIAIEGMSCGGCVQNVSKALQSVTGVTIADVAVGSARIEVANPEALKRAIEAVEKAGYKAQADPVMPAAKDTSGGGGCCGG